MSTWQDRPFWWVSRSGRERVLVWIPWTGYALSHVMTLDRDWVGRYQERLESVGFPYEVSYVRWSGHGDNAAPDTELSTFVRSWNAQFTAPRFAIASTSDAFAELERRHGRELPELRGDLTPFWEDGAGSSALETRLNRNAADRLTQAEALYAGLAPGAYPAATFNDAWRDVLLYSEHTWGAWNSVSDAENAFVTKQWAFKRAFAVRADEQSQVLLNEALAAGGGAAGGREIEVHNTVSWPRAEVVVLPAAMAAAGRDRVLDSRGRAVPSQRLRSGELAFLPHEAVPGFGRARFSLAAGRPETPPRPVTVENGVLDNGVIRVAVDLATGDVAELRLTGRGGNLIDVAEAANGYRFLAGSDVATLERGGAATLTVEDAGPLVATLRAESAAPGCRSLVRRVSLTAGSDWVSLSNRVDKSRAPENPGAGPGGPGGDFAQHGGKESVQFAFAFQVPGGVMRMDVPLAEMRPEVDQIPGTCKNWMPVGRWIDVANAEVGVTWVTLDAPAGGGGRGLGESAGVAARPGGVARLYRADAAVLLVGDE